VNLQKQWLRIYLFSWSIVRKDVLGLRNLSSLVLIKLVDIRSVLHRAAERFAICASRQLSFLSKVVIHVPVAPVEVESVLFRDKAG